MKALEATLHTIVAAAGLPDTRRDELLGLKKEDLLRAIVDKVGKPGTAGQALQNVISVAMLSEGWDAKDAARAPGANAAL